MPKAMAKTTPLSDTSQFWGVSPTSPWVPRQDEVDEGPPPVIADDAADVLSPNLPYSSAADGEASRSRALAALDFDGAFQCR